MSAIIERLEFIRRIFNNSYNTSAKAINIITEVDNEILNGNAYGLTNIFTLGASGGGSDVRWVGIETAADEDARLYEIMIKSDVNYVKLELYEGVTFTGNTEYPPVNLNRQSTNTPNGKIYATFTVAPSGGSVIETYTTIGGATVPSANIGGEETSGRYKVLKRSTKYALKYTNVSGDAANVQGKAIAIITDLTD